MPQIGPEIVKGIEINPYAAERARVTVWIGQIQWMIQHGFSANRRPILEPLDTIENHDALIIEAEEELDALQRLLVASGYAPNDGMLLSEISRSRNGFGLMGLLAAFGLDIWTGDDD